MGGFEAALADATRAIELAPDSSRSYLVRGLAYSGVENDDRAIEDFTRAIELIQAIEWPSRPAHPASFDCATLAPGPTSIVCSTETRGIPLAIRCVPFPKQPKTSWMRHARTWSAPSRWRTTPLTVIAIQEIRADLLLG